MKKLFLLVISSLLFANVFAQGEASIWYVGGNIKMDFSGGGDPVIGNGIPSGAAGNLTESTSSISDEEGNLLFAVVDDKIYDGAEQIAFSLTSGTWDVTQGTIIFPVPGTSNKYYLVEMKRATNGVQNTTPSSVYYTITVTGTGADNISVSAPTNLLADLTEAQVGVLKANSTSEEYWLVAHEKCNNNFKVFSVTSSGITLASTQAVGPSLRCTTEFPPIVDQIGIMKFNSCYTQLAYTIGQSVQLYDFDAETGTLTFVNEVTSITQPYGVEFSTNGEYLYVLKGYDNSNPGQIYSMPINAQGLGNPTSLGTTGGMRGGHLQIAPDGNIYYSIPESFGLAGKGKIGRITNINNGGVLDNEFYTATRGSFTGGSEEDQWVNMDMPTFVRSFITNVASLKADGIDIKEAQICQGSAVNLSIESGETVVQWTVEGTTYTGTSATHTFANAGETEVELITTTSCGTSKTQTFTFDILAIEVATVEYNDAEAERCTGDAVTVNATGSSNGEYLWYDAASEGNIIATSSSYTYQGKFPSTVWVSPAGKLYDGVGGASTEDAISSSYAGNFTKFEVTDELILKSVDFTSYGSFAGCSSGSIGYEIRKDKVDGTVVKEGSMDVSTCEVQTLALNTKLSAGTYYMILSEINGVSIARSFATYTGPYIGANGKINVLGNTDNNFGNDGTFFNFITQETLLCVERTAFEITEKCCQPLALDLGADIVTCETEVMLNPQVSDEHFYEWIILEGTGIESAEANKIINLSVGENVIVYRANNPCDVVYDTIKVVVLEETSADGIIIENEDLNEPLCLDEYLLEVQNPQGSEISFFWSIPDELEASNNGQESILITPKAGIRGASDVSVEITGACGTINKEVSLNWSNNPTTENAEITDVEDLCANDNGTQNYEVTGVVNATNYVWSAIYKDKDGVDQLIALSGSDALIQTDELIASLEDHPMGDSEQDRIVTISARPSNKCGVSSTITESLIIYNTPSEEVIEDEITICLLDDIRLNAYEPQIGLGTWEVVSGTATIDELNDPYSSITGLENNQPLVATWTVKNGVCASVSIEQTIIGEDAVVPTLTLEADETEICEGQSVTLTLTGENHGEQAEYSFIDADEVILSSDNASTLTLSPTSTILVRGQVISSASCTENGIVSTELLAITVKPIKQCIVGTESENLTELSAYPNPFTSTITLSNIPTNVEKVQVIDVLGNVVESVENVNSTLELGQDLAKGTYLIYLYSENGIQVERVVKIN